MIQGFEYPTERHHRRHGPTGYTNYESYRPWLRDEFMFRCVYCLHRERWNAGDTTFNIDHFIPVSAEPGLICEYTNLLYACSRCNRAKTNIVGIPDPCQVAFGECLEIRETGNVDALNPLGHKICDALALNSTKRVDARHRWIRTLEYLREENPALFTEYMGFPSDVDDLRPPKLQPPENTFPTSVDDCFFVQREQGRLAETY